MKLGQLSLTFLALLACLLSPLEAFAMPTIPERRDSEPRTITLPLTRLHKARDDVHPLILLQQHINRGQRRLAKMSGRTEPPQSELRANLERRVALLENSQRSLETRGGDVTGSHFSKRRFRTGKAAANSGSARGGSTSSSAVPGTSGTSVSASSPATSSATSSDTTGSNGAGVAEIDIEAAESGALTLANPPTANLSLGLDIEADDVGYVATVQIGTPPQDFFILMDTGSADFWVGSENCQSCGNHTLLGPDTSSTFVETDTQFSVTYGSGAVQGVLCSDNVNIAGLELTNHSFGVATEESEQFGDDDIPFDGLMGLAQSGISEEGVPTPVESLASNGLISSAIASFKISRLSDELNDGEVTFGGLDSTKFIASTLTTFPNVNTEGFWEGSMTAITVNGADSGLTGRTAILDTGTTLIIAPPSDADTVISMLGGSSQDGQYIVPCTLNASVALTFGGEAFTIEPQDIAVLPVDLNDPTGDCTAGIQAGEVGTDTEWLVGDVFLKNAYFVVNTSNNSISLAQLSSP